MSVNIYEELEWRDIIYSTNEGTREVLTQTEHITGYIGFDPTAPSLHVGSLLPIMTLVRLQSFGHTPIVLIGGGTGMIGDPSGKTHERRLLSKDQIEYNLQHIKIQLSSFLDFESTTNPASLCNNFEWLESLSTIDFLRNVGKHFTVNYMLTKESVKGRNEQGEGISFTEFSYMLLQAYDFLVLRDRYHCLIQLGASDQWGNIIAGIDLIRRVRGEKAYGLVFPLVTNTLGVKFGKTEAGTIWLDPNLTSPFRFYQFWLNTDDRDVVKYLKFFTKLKQNEIEELAISVAQTPEKREAQRRLAQEVTRMVHSEGNLRRAIQASEVLFGGDIVDLNAQDILDIFSDVPSLTMQKAFFETEGLPLIDIVNACGYASSRNAARKLIENGGIYVNNRRTTDVQLVIHLSAFIEGQYLVMRKGAKDYCLVRIVV